MRCRVNYQRQQRESKSMSSLSFDLECHSGFQGIWLANMYDLMAIK